MYYGKRSISLLIALLMVLSLIPAIMTSCDTGSGDATSAPDAESSLLPDDSSSDDPGASDVMDLVINGKTNIKIIRHADLENYDPQVEAAVNIRKQIMNATGADVRVEDDWIQSGADHNHDTVEILVGNTNYSETAEAKKDLRYGDYLLTVVGSKIVVLGYTDSALNSASNALIRLIKAAIITDEATGTKSLSLKKSEVYSTGVKNSTISAMPVYDGGTLSAYYDCGVGDELIFGDATLDTYNAYVQKLIDAGYKKHTSNIMNGNVFTTLFNSSHTVNVGFYAYYKEVRAVIEPYTTQSLTALESENVTDTVTTGQITMIGLEYVKADGTNVNNGLSILIRLTDGRFIVVDGGFTNNQNHADLMLAQMKAQSADYADKTGGIKVAAWIVTHSHGDHNGMINSKYNTLKNNGVKVEKFIVNFLSDAELVKCRAAYSANWSATEGNSWTATVEACSAFGADLVNARVGQVYYMANVKMEVLYTVDSLGPRVCNALNATSIVIKMTFTDPVTKKETVYMSTGDATGAGFRICADMFGPYLKSDLVQVAHHGATPWGNETGTIAAYRAMAPTGLVWPMGSKAYPNYKNKSYNVVLWNASNPNYKETYVAGVEGNITVIPLPYVPGTVTQSIPQ